MASSSSSSPDTASKALGLLKAVFDGNLRRLKKLAAALDNGSGKAQIIASIRDPFGLSALHLAALQGKVDICKYLIHDLKLDVDLRSAKTGETPLQVACSGGNLSTAVYLLKKGANPDLANDGGRTPLHWAAEKGHKDLLLLLLSKGVNVDVQSEGVTPLQKASSQGKHEVVKVLLDHHANPNLSSDLVLSPMMASITANSLQCVEHLLEAGADPNGDTLGTTPLEIVACLGQTDMAECLLKAGADPDLTNVDDLKPIEIAALNSNHQVAQILFPVTSPILTYPDWSVDGITRHIHSEEGRVQRKLKKEEILAEEESKATDAFWKNDYHMAIFFFSKVICADPYDATLLANRSLCWAHLNKGERALSDAMTCIMLKPDWPEAYYMAGVAWGILGKFDQAADVFSEGLKLDPEDKELQSAYQDAVEAKSIFNLTSRCVIE